MMCHYWVRGDMSYNGSLRLQWLISGQGGYGLLQVKEIYTFFYFQQWQPYTPHIYKKREKLQFWAPVRSLNEMKMLYFL